MNLSHAIQALYPNAIPLEDFEVRDDGAGPYISYFNEAKLGPQPARADLERGWFLYVKEKKLEEFTSRFSEVFAQLFPESGAAAGEESAAERKVKALMVAIVDVLVATSADQTKRAQIRDVRDKLRRARAAVESKTQANSTAEQIQALRWEEQ